MRLAGVWATASNDVWVVGSHTLHYDGTHWSTVTSPRLGSVWGNSSSNLYATGSQGIYRYDGIRWTKINDTPGGDLWGTATDLFVITADAVLHGTY